jgi:hypothetical protein
MQERTPAGLALSRLIRCSGEYVGGSDPPLRRKRQAPTVGDDGGMDVAWDRSVDAAYISLIPPEERTYGVAARKADRHRGARRARHVARVDLASSALADCRNEVEAVARLALADHGLAICHRE